MNSKIQDVKKNYTNFFKSYATRGFQKISSSNSLFFKLFWIIYFLVTISLAIYFTTKAIISYLKYEVIQKTETVFPNQITFPTITLCSDIFIDRSIINYIDTCSFNLNDDCKINPDNYFKIFRSYSTGRNCFQFNGGKSMSNNSIPIQNSTLPEKPNGFILNFTTSSTTSTISTINSSTSSITTNYVTTTTSTSSITNSSTSSTIANTPTQVTNNSSFTNNQILKFIESNNNSLIKSSKSQSIDIFIDDPSSPSFINQIDYKNPD